MCSAEAPRAPSSLPKSKCCFVLPEHFVFAHIRKWLPMLSGHTSCFTGDEHGRGSSPQSLARRARGSSCAPACPTLHFTSIPFSHHPTLLPGPCRNNQLCPVRVLLPTKTLGIGRIPKAWGCCQPHPHTGPRVPRDSSSCLWDILHLKREILDFFHEEGGFCVFHVTGPGGALHSRADALQLQRNLPHWNVMPCWLKRANKWTK